MPLFLDWDLVDIPLCVGLNTRDDGKLLPPLRLLDLQNGVFGKGGALRKRNGYTDLSQQTLAVSPASISACVQLATRGDELLQLDGTKHYSYSAAASRWSDRGNLLNVELTADTVCDSQDNQTSADCATAGGLTVYAWENTAASPDEVLYAVYDSATGSVVQAPVVLASNADRPRVVAVGDVVLVLYHDTANADIRVKRIVAADLAASLAASTIAFGYSDIHASAALDCVGFSTYAVWATRTAANALRVGVVLPTGALGGPASSHGYPVDAFSIDQTAIAVSAWEQAGLTNASVVYSTGADVMEATFTGIRNEDADPIVASGPYTISVDNPTRVTCVKGSNNSTHIWWEIAGGTRVVKYVLSTGGTPGTAVAIRRSSLGSHAFLIGTAPYVHLHHSSDLQGTYFLTDADHYPHARVLAGTGYGPDTSHLPKVSSPATSQYEWAAAFKHRLRALNEDVYTQPGVTHVVYDTSKAPSRCDRRGTLLLGAGLVWSYDGVGATESGFLLFPEDITTDNGSVGSGSLSSSGVYTYAAYWEWYNDNGDRELSTTAGLVSVTMGASDNTIVLTIPSLCHTWKRGSRRAPVLALYRSALNGTARYRVTSLDPTVTTPGADGYYKANDPTSDSITYEDRMSDTTLITKELDYLNSAGATELDNVAPPSLRALAEVQGRIWGVSAENRRRVFYSKLAKDETAVEWNDALYLDMPVPITGIGDIAGRPVLFGEDSIYIVDGEGPDNLGIGSYGRPERINSDVGLYAPRTLVKLPVGWMFQTRKGFWLLAGNLQVSYVGSDVASYNSQTFTGAELVADTNEVRLLTSSGRTLVFNYEKAVWSTFTRHEGTASVVWRGVYTYGTSAGLVRTEAAGTYRDSGNAIALALTSAWFKPGQSVQGFGAVERVLILGRYRSVHRLRVEVGYDYEDFFRETYEIDPSDFIESATWGDSGTWGSDTVWGGSGNTDVYQARRGLVKRTCQAIRFRITEIPTEDAGEGLELNLLTLSVGRIRGSNRLADNRTV